MGALPIPEDSTTAAVRLFRETVPRRAYCTDNPSMGQYVRPHDAALLHSHIQPNARKLVRWLCFDLDHPQAAHQWEDRNAAPPTLAMVNPKNGHAHYAYALEVPVSKSEISRIKPLEFMAAIEEGTRRNLKADPGFSGGLIKTPGHKAWRTISFAPAYELHDLAEWCDLPSPHEMRYIAANSAEYAGLGRNCLLFDNVRKRSYRDVRQFWRPGGFDEFAAHCMALSELYNRIANPLPISEVKSVARSVAKWTWRNFTPQEFRELQSERGKRKGATRRALLLPRAVEMAQDGLTQREIGELLNVPKSTVDRWLKKA